MVAPSNPVSMALWCAAVCLADRYRHKWLLTFQLVSDSSRSASLIDEDRLRLNFARKADGHRMRFGALAEHVQEPFSADFTARRWESFAGPRSV